MDIREYFLVAVVVDADQEQELQEQAEMEPPEQS
jgi:hypothetical protein